MRFDIAVVGSGLAALVATRSLQKAGRQPVLIWPGLSSLYFVYATIDVLGYRDATATEPVDNPRAAIGELIAAHPDHVYARAGLEALTAGTALALDWLREAGFSWRGGLDRNVVLPTATGTPKPSCLIPDSMAGGDLGRDDPVIFCGFEGYEDFVPELAASNLSRTWGHAPGSVRGLRIRPPRFAPGRLFTSIDLARSFEDVAFRREVADRVRTSIATNGDRVRIGVPAVLGLTHVADTHARFEEEVGHPVFEIPTLPPSVLALRLFDRLRKHLQETGIELIWAAPAHAAEVSDGRCHRIQLKSPGREQAVEARAYVLALEDTADGAMRAGVHTIQDPFFHRVLARSDVPTERTLESLFKPQPFAQVGYRITDRLQPADDDGRPLADNVFVAGGAIAGYDPSGTKSRGGMAIATGYRAAQEAMAA
ncbi:MAG: anaerobic glycerol-3-phosphate dehydrogenase subunit B [Chloroflexi bacterium]|nr:MAG: anaerobic glycerol-3-phosphate dehydrogenase subunit B [Chloroflexota bacterium]TME47252.1 MAG: anaerobic glycerol-3-phosphate dehydrogenase subunit B [Chloroflexota bacterium]